MRYAQGVDAHDIVFLPKLTLILRQESAVRSHVRVLSVLGTRPRSDQDGADHRASGGRRIARRIECRVCTTAQHRAMVDDVLALFGITPEYDLDVMQARQSPAQVAAAILARLLTPVLELSS